MFIKKKITFLSETELIERYRKTGDHYLIGEIFSRYTRFVFCVCMKYLKDQEESRDTVMDIFEKLTEDLKTNEILNFKPWLHTVAKNHCLLKLRSQNTRLKKETEMQKEMQMVMESDEKLYPMDENQAEDYMKNLGKAIGLLNPEQKKCIELFYLQEKCYVEVAEMTGFNMNQVKSYIQNGKRNLKNFLLQKNE